MLAVYVMLIVAASFNLGRWHTLLSAAVASVLEVQLQLLAGTVPLGATVLSVVLLWITAAMGLRAGDSTVALVREFAAEQLRRARLGRYFSPQVIELFEARGDAFRGLVDGLPAIIAARRGGRT